eukprot:jgi/Mesvir1/10375/Mv10575-RA.1
MAPRSRDGRFHSTRQDVTVRYASEAHERFCKHGGPFDHSPAFKLDEISLNYSKLEIRDYKQTPIPLGRRPKWLPEKSTSLTIDTFYHELLDPMVRNAVGYVKGGFPDLIDMEWHRRCSEYLRELPQLDLISLVSYTVDSFGYTNSDKSKYARAFQTNRDEELRDAEEGHATPFYRLNNPTWPGLVRLITDGVKGKPFSRLDPVKICYKPFDLEELRQGIRWHLAEREKDPTMDLSASAPLRDRLANLSAWRDVIETIASLDHRHMDILYLLTMWVSKYLNVNTLKEGAVRYQEDFRRVLAAAPVIGREMTVYRGVTSHYYRPADPSSDTYVNKFPVSTSVSAEQSIRFLNSTTNTGKHKSPSCCFKVIRLAPGTPALCLWPVAPEPMQAEILLPVGITYRIRSHTRQQLVAGVPRFSPWGVDREEVCWERIVKRANREETAFPNSWVTEIDVDGSNLSSRKRKRDPEDPSPARAANSGESSGGLGRGERRGPDAVAGPSRARESSERSDGSARGDSAGRREEGEEESSGPTVMYARAPGVAREGPARPTGPVPPWQGLRGRA